MIPSKTVALARLEKAYDIAVQAGNARLANTLLPMLQAEKVKSVRSTSGTDLNSAPTKVSRCATNPRRMKVKSKLELYDTTIEIPSETEIAERFASYKQKQLVFQRG